MSEKTPIEMVCEHFRSADAPPGSDEISVAEILVPEQCAEIYIGHKTYHVTVEEIAEEPAKAVPLEDDSPNKLSPEFMREAQDAVQKAEKEIQDFKESDVMRCRTQFEVIAVDLMDHPVVLCHAESLEDLFDKLAPWYVEGMLGLYEMVNIVRAMRAAPLEPSGWNQGLDCDFTKPFQINEDSPSVIIQMS